MKCSVLMFYLDVPAYPCIHSYENVFDERVRVRVSA